jgi:DUF1365 family protein
MTVSRLYRGTISHERTRPARNRFTYGTYYIYVDLDELDDLDRSLKRFAHDGRALFSFHDVDHGPRDGSPLRPWIDGVLERAGIDLDGGPVRMLSFPRVWGLHFNPVSFWYCFHSDGSPRAVLAEVSNTFGEHHNYLLHDEGRPMSWDQEPEATKVFHVSPFIPMDARYRFRFAPPSDEIGITMDEAVDGTPLLHVRLSMRAEPLTDAGILKAFLRFGPMTARALLLIHWQALKIVAKRIRYIPRPEPPEEETTV